MHMNRVLVAFAPVALGLMSIIASATAPGMAAAPTPVIVATAYGRVQGRLLTGNKGSAAVRVFKGVPFAAPPVGPLRWRAPQPPKAWHGVRPALHFASPCMQPPSPHRLGPWSSSFLNSLPSSEDCLYLNVWAPAASSRQAPRPVMVWIYGGGFTSGGANVTVYNGAALARKGVVLVSVNYRVGPFGFLAARALTNTSPRHSSGNYALLDQIAALRWVHDNIGNFGGNPRQVTIFGQSAGAFSVGLLMQSPRAQGLFQRAIIMSGPGVLPFLNRRPSLAQSEQQGAHVMSACGVHTLAALRALPASSIESCAGRFRWTPTRDGWVTRSGWRPARQVAVINGMVADDMGIGDYSNDPAPRNLSSYRATLRRACGDRAAECARLYPAHNDRQASREQLKLLRERARVSLYLWARRQRHWSPQVYTYCFTHVMPWPKHPNYGAYHSSELPYAFNNLARVHRPWTAADARVAREMSTYWTNFAKRGDPNGPQLAHWPAFRAQPLTMRLGAHAGPMPLASPAAFRFWRTQLLQLRK